MSAEGLRPALELVRAAAALRGAALLTATEGGPLRSPPPERRGPRRVVSAPIPTFVVAAPEGRRLAAVLSLSRLRLEVGLPGGPGGPVSVVVVGRRRRTAYTYPPRDLASTMFFLLNPEVEGLVLEAAQSLGLERGPEAEFGGLREALESAGSSIDVDEVLGRAAEREAERWLEGARLEVVGLAGVHDPPTLRVCAAVGRGWVALRVRTGVGALTAKFERYREGLEGLLAVLASGPALRLLSEAGRRIAYEAARSYLALRALRRLEEGEW